MVTNTTLLGLVIGSLPSIFDKKATSEKLVNHHHHPPHHPSRHHPPLPLHHLHPRSPLFCCSSWSPTSTGLTTTLGLFHIFIFFLSVSYTICAVIVSLTRWFMLATITSHWIFSQDYPNFVVLCVHTLTSCIPAFHLTLATGGRCLQSHEGSGQGVLLKCLLQPLRLRQLSLQGCSKLKNFLLHQQPQERLASLRSQWNSYVWCVSLYRTHSVSCDFLSNSMISCKYVVCVINGKMSLGPSVKVKVKDHPSRKTLL